MLGIILLLGTVCLLFYYYLVKPLSFFKNKGIKQGNPVWVFGDFWKSTLRILSIPELIDYLYKQWPNERYFGLYQFVMPTFCLKDPELIKQITVKAFDHFENHRNFVPENVDPLWNKNLFALKGQRWRDMRPILSPSFTSSKMRAMFVLMSDCAKNFTNFFLQKNEDYIEIDLKDIFSRYCNDVIATTAFGVEVNSLENRNNNFYIMGKKATIFNGFWKNLRIMGYFMMPKVYELLKIGLFEEDVSKFFYELVNETIKAREENGIVRPDMIHLLLEARKGKTKPEETNHIDAGFSVVQEVQGNGHKPTHTQITNEDITSQAMIFFFAGFETVSMFMSFVGYELAVNPDIQERLRQEVLETLDNCGGKLTYEALLKMKYMDMVISETLRKWPAAIATDRLCTRPYTIQPVHPNEKPVHIEVGDLIWIPIYALHRDPKYFPNPDRFDPERFSDENRTNINPYAYIPFGVGPRNCIGSRFALLENKVVFFNILANFEILLTEKTNVPLKFAKSAFNLSSVNGFPLAFKRIKK